MVHMVSQCARIHIVIQFVLPITPRILPLSPPLLLSLSQLHPEPLKSKFKFHFFKYFPFKFRVQIQQSNPCTLRMMAVYPNFYNKFF